MAISFRDGGMDFIINFDSYKMAATGSVSATNFLTIGIIHTPLQFIASHLGLNYTAYNIILFGVCIILLLKYLRKLTESPAFFFSCFMIYPMIDSGIQQRYFPAMIMMYIAYYYWIRDERKKTILFTLLAIGFHMVAMSLFLFLIFDYGIKHKPRFTITSALILEIFFIVALPKILDFVGVDYFINKYRMYTEEQHYSSWRIATIFIVAQAIYTVSVILIDKDDNEKLLRKKYSPVGKMNILSLLFIPILVYGSPFLRFFRPIQMVNYGYIGDCLAGPKNHNSYKKQLCKVFTLWLAVETFVLMQANRSLHFLGYISDMYNGNIIFRNLFG